jgi:hypothetical protein
LQWLLNLLNSAPVTALEADEAALGNYSALEADMTILAAIGGIDSVPGIQGAEAAGMAASAAAAKAAPAGVSAGVPAAGLADTYRSGVGGAGAGGAGVSASLGRAASVSALSVPQSWATASPPVRLAATALPIDGVGAWAGSAAPGGMFNGMCPVGSVVNAPRDGESRRADSRLRVIAQMPGEPAVGQNSPGRWAKPDQHAPHDPSALSERERDELVTLRKELAELATERDAAARLIKEAIRR